MSSSEFDDDDVLSEDEARILRGARTRPGRRTRGKRAVHANQGKETFVSIQELETEGVYVAALPAVQQVVQIVRLKRFSCYCSSLTAT